MTAGFNLQINYIRAYSLESARTEFIIKLVYNNNITNYGKHYC